MQEMPLNIWLATPQLEKKANCPSSGGIGACWHTFYSCGILQMYLSTEINIEIKRRLKVSGISSL